MRLLTEPRAGLKNKVYFMEPVRDPPYDGPASVSSIPSGMTKSAAAAIVFL